jgi:F0F1-type ATP synthase assembly protein I
MKQYGVVMVATTELIVTIVILLFLGQWVDKKWEQGQTGIIVGAILGAIVGFTRFVMRLQKMNKEGA